jgi:hypothetical protein
MTRKRRCRPFGRGFFEPVDGSDVGVFELGENLCFALETGQTLGVLGDVFRQDLDRDVTLELRVGRAVDLAHAARTERGGDLVRTEPRAGLQGHILPSLPASRKARKEAERNANGWTRE